MFEQDRWISAIFPRVHDFTSPKRKYSTLLRLVQSKFINVVYYSYSNNYYVGTATVKIDGNKWDDNFNTGTREVTFKILPMLITNAKIDKIEDQIYSGKAIKPHISVELDGIIFYPSFYTVSYKNNKNIGKATLTITGKGNYTGTKSTTFNIIPDYVNDLHSPGESVSGQVTLQWSKDKKVDGYEIQYGLKRSFKGAKTVKIKKGSTTKATIKQLKGGKDYYFRIRSYKKVRGKTYYSYWSRVVLGVPVI